MAVRLFVGNLPYSATEADLRAHFTQVAEPSHVAMPVDRETGRPRGFAFVEFTEREKAEEVINRFNAQPFLGRSLAVSEARAREDRPAGGGFGGPRPIPGAGGFGGSRPIPGGGGFGGPRPGGGFGGPRPGGGGFGPPSGPPGSRDRSANFGPPAPPKRLRGKKGAQQDSKPKGPIKERSGGRIYAVDDLEDGEVGEFENFAVRTDEDEKDDASAEVESGPKGDAQDDGDDDGDE